LPRAAASPIWSFTNDRKDHEMARNTGTNSFAQVALWLAVVGAINWGLVGFFDFDLVRAIFGGQSSTPSSALSRVVYAIVGLAGVALAIVGPRLRARDADAARLGRPAETRA
jgi:uncharacterized membrane protein YuzA (DUF378 family)